MMLCCSGISRCASPHGGSAAWQRSRNCVTIIGRTYCEEHANPQLFACVGLADGLGGPSHLIVCEGWLEVTGFGVDGNLAVGMINSGVHQTVRDTQILMMNWLTT